MGSPRSTDSSFRSEVYDSVHRFNTVDGHQEQRKAFGHLIEPYYTEKGASTGFRLLQWILSIFGKSNLQKAKSLLADHVWKDLTTKPRSTVPKKDEVDLQVALFLKGIPALALIRSKSNPSTWSKDALPEGTAYQGQLTLQQLMPRTPSPVAQGESRSSSPISTDSASTQSSGTQTSRDFDGRGQYFLWDATTHLWLPLPCDAMNVADSLRQQGAQDQAIRTAMLVGTQSCLNELSTALMPEYPPKGFDCKNVSMDKALGYTVYFAVEQGQVKVRVEGQCQICDIGQKEGPKASVTAFYDPTHGANHVELRATYL